VQVEEEGEEVRKREGSDRKGKEKGNKGKEA
jgi:hypothetical protein